MYPILRMMKETWLQRRAPRIGFFDTHVSMHRCWPWDIDPWMELNNGRTLTLYDLGRIPLLLRNGITDALRQTSYGMTVAGANVRYRRRIQAFERFEMRTKVIGWDHRFVYLEQSLWKKAECANHLLVRVAVTNPKKPGIVPPIELIQVIDAEAEANRPEIPEWVQTWIESEGQRPWPPKA